MKNIRRTNRIVRVVLEQHPETRNSDNLLYVRVVENINANLIYKPFQELFMHAKDYGIPPFESVRRARQKLQAEIPELKAKKEVESERKTNEQIVKDFATDCQWR